MEFDPAAIASPRALFAVGLGILAFLTAGAPVGILAVSIPAGIAAIVLAAGELRNSSESDKPTSRWLALAGVGFTVLGFALAAAWIYVGMTYASMFGGPPHSLDLDGLLCTVCSLLGRD